MEFFGTGKKRERQSWIQSEKAEPHQGESDTCLWGKWKSLVQSRSRSGVESISVLGFSSPPPPFADMERTVWIKRIFYYFIKNAGQNYRTSVVWFTLCDMTCARSCSHKEWVPQHADQLHACVRSQNFPLGFCVTNLALGEVLSVLGDPENSLKPSAISHWQSTWVPEPFPPTTLQHFEIRGQHDSQKLCNSSLLRAWNWKTLCFQQIDQVQDKGLYGGTQ